MTDETQCPKCGEQLKVIVEHQDGDNIPPGGFTETFVECPNGCDISEVDEEANTL